MRSYQENQDLEVQDHFMQVFSALSFLKEIRMPSL